MTIGLGIVMTAIAALVVFFIGDLYDWWGVEEGDTPDMDSDPPPTQKYACTDMGCEESDTGAFDSEVECKRNCGYNCDTSNLGCTHVVTSADSDEVPSVSFAHTPTPREVCNANCWTGFNCTESGCVLTKDVSPDFADKATCEAHCGFSCNTDESRTEACSLAKDSATYKFKDHGDPRTTCNNNCIAGYRCTDAGCVFAPSNDPNFPGVGPSVRDECNKRCGYSCYTQGCYLTDYANPNSAILSMLPGGGRPSFYEDDDPLSTCLDKCYPDGEHSSCTNRGCYRAYYNPDFLDTTVDECNTRCGYKCADGVCTHTKTDPVVSFAESDDPFSECSRGCKLGYKCTDSGCASTSWQPDYEDGTMCASNCGYRCDSTGEGCELVTMGASHTFAEHGTDAESICAGSCVTKWACNADSTGCVRSDTGTYDDEATCNAACVRWGCTESGGCQPDASGPFVTESDCRSNCGYECSAKRCRFPSDFGASTYTKYSLADVDAICACNATMAQVEDHCVATSNVCSRL